MKNVSNIFITHRTILIISAFYFIFHFINLTLLPIFNDESIYLDWAWVHTHIPGHAYDALLDAKQPLLIWIFGFFERLFPDPLFAGRFVAVVFGYLTMLGVYFLSKIVTSQRVAYLSAVMFSIIPIFVFYNRQALMESAIASVGIWSCIFLIRIIRNPTIKDSVLLGSVLGIGFFIKSSSVLFIVSAICVISIFIFVKKKVMLINALCITLVTFFVVDLLLFINPLFWETFSSNSRYSLTLFELLSFPIQTWVRNLLGFFEIGFVFMSPVVFSAGLAGTYLFLRKSSQERKIFLLFFFIAIFLEILAGRTQSQRYLVSFLPFIVIPASYVLLLLWKGVVWKKSIVIVSLILPLLVSLMILFNPDRYILRSHNISGYADMHHIRGQTSGYGINETLDYLQTRTGGTPALVVFAVNTGNPENAINLYAHRSPNLIPMYIDKQFFPDLASYSCLGSDYPFYFVTRDEQLAGMNSYFTQEKKFLNPDGVSFVGIYVPTKNCTGNTLSLSDVYAQTINVLMLRKRGVY